MQQLYPSDNFKKMLNAEGKGWGQETETVKDSF